MLQKKIDELLSSMFNAFSIADYIIIAGLKRRARTRMKHYERYSGDTDRKLKLNKDRCLFRFTSIPFFDEVIL